jgi:hypothetical protein
MNTLLSLVFVVGGFVLSIYGATAPKSLRDDLPRVASGPFSGRPVWLLIGGAAGTLAGLVGLLHGSLVQ